MVSGREAVRSAQAWPRLPLPYLLAGRLAGTLAATLFVGAALFVCLRSCAETPLYGPSGISALAVRQGSLGSCFFHASVAAVAKGDPAAIRKAILGEASKGYRVHFVDGPEELVYREDLEYARHHNYDKSEGEWVAVLMRAYAQRELRQSMIQAIHRSTAIPTFAKPAALAALQQTSPLLVAYDRAIRSVVNQDGQVDKASFKIQLSKEFSTLGIPPAQSRVLEGLLEQAGFFESISKTVQDNGEVFGAYRSIGQGGIPINVIEAIMGRARSGVMTNQAELAAALSNFSGSGRAMVAGTKGAVAAEDLVGQTSPEQSWFVANHAYTVMDYDERTQKVSLRNPWASRPLPDGKFVLSLATFRRTFYTYTASVSRK